MRERELDVFRAVNRIGHVQYTMRKTPFKRSEKEVKKRVGWDGKTQTYKKERKKSFLSEVFSVIAYREKISSRHTQ